MLPNLPLAFLATLIIFACLIAGLSFGSDRSLINPVRPSRALRNKAGSRNNQKYRYAQAKAKNDLYIQKYSKAYLDVDGVVKFRGDGLFPELRNLAKSAKISTNATCGEAPHIDPTQGEFFCKLTEHVERLRKEGLAFDMQTTVFRKRRSLQAQSPSFAKKLKLYRQKRENSDNDYEDESLEIMIPDVAEVDWALSNILSENYDDVSNIETIQVIDHDEQIKAGHNKKAKNDIWLAEGSKLTSQGAKLTLNQEEDNISTQQFLNTLEYADYDLLDENDAANKLLKNYPDIYPVEDTFLLQANDPSLKKTIYSKSNANDRDQCSFCIAENHHISNAIDGGESWWQSPSIAAVGYAGHKVSIDLDLRAHFQVAYIIIKAANSPRPGDWVLEKSMDGKSWEPWQLFATDATRCRQLTTKFRKMGYNHVVQYYDETEYNQEKPDDSVHCTTQASALVDTTGDQLENGEIIIRLINGRRSQNWPSKQLLKFLTARYIRFRFLKVRTLMADLMSLQNDVTVTRRYYYSIKDISVGGMCICNGHATSCNVTKLIANDENSDLASACECQHNTIGASCEKCLPFHHQYPWRPGTSDWSANATRYCESCNCNQHTDKCQYEEWADTNKMSTDIYGVQSGGGVCQNCQGNTRGVNCQGCQFEYYRDPKADLTEPCKRCQCSKVGSIPKKFQGSVFLEGYEWRQFLPKENILVDASQLDVDNPKIEIFYDCDYDKTDGDESGEHDFQCHCKTGYTGKRCESCAFGWQREIENDITSKCIKCKCDSYGTEGDPCSYPCQCKPGVTGETCNQCKPNFFNFNHMTRPCLECYCNGHARTDIEGSTHRSETASDYPFFKFFKYLSIFQSS